MNNATLRRLCQRVLSCDSMADSIATLERFAKRLPEKRKRGTWGFWSNHMVRSLKIEKVPFKVFARGNGKLPFYAFSALPEFTCPGAGDCLDWCYSFRAWRYPAAFFRQLQNTLLLRFNPETIADSFLALPIGHDVRLYVDGDFESAERVAFWMVLIDQRADLSVYGYSKSWAQLLEHHHNVGTWPVNYTLNLSSGSKWADNPTYRHAMEQLPITRGRFVAVPIDGHGLPKGTARYDNPDYHNRVRDALREQFGKRVVSCGGSCGDCGNAKHWCGDREKLDNVVIGIGIH